MLIAVAGFSGAGKTSAVRYLASRNVGEVYYAGKIITDEVAAQGLPLSAENERCVRLALREEEGLDVVARRVIAATAKTLARTHVLLDAIYLPAESDRYRQSLEERLVVVGIDACFETRADRLLCRSERPCSKPDLEARDQTELIKLRLDRVLASVDFRIDNDGSLDDFHERLDQLAQEQGWCS